MSWLWLVVAVCVWVFGANSAAGDTKRPPKEQALQSDYLQPGSSAAEVLRGSGYLVKEFFFYTNDGYKINIIRARNPLINGGKSGLAGTLPILFVHGSVDAAPTLLSTTTRARPRNFSPYLKRLKKVRSGERLIELLNGDPSTASTAFLALNFGYECWFVNRRGFNTSKGRRGHENRTLADAIASIPHTFLANGHHPDWLSARRPHVKADEMEQDTRPDGTTKHNRNRDNHSALSFWRDLFHEFMTLKNLPKALANFDRFEEHFIQTFDPDYWNFSLDEQAEHEIPDAIEFVVEQTGCSRVHTVSLSSGAALILLAAAERPKLASKIASAILWAPALNMGSAKDIIYQLSQLLPITQSYSGPIPFVFNQQQIAGLFQGLCVSDFMQRHFCSRVIDLLFGYSGTQGPIKPSILANLLEPTSYHELSQLGQFAHTSRPCKFKFNDPKKNLERYGQLEPPCYDLSRVQIEFISIYAGNEDLFITPGDMNITISQLSVPVKMNLINETGIHFNHGASITHEQTDRLVQSPSFLDIRRVESSHWLASEAANCHVR